MRAFRVLCLVLLAVLSLAASSLVAQDFYGFRQTVTYFDTNNNVVGGDFYPCIGAGQSWGTPTTSSTSAFDFNCPVYSQQEPPPIGYPAPYNCNIVYVSYLDSNGNVIREEQHYECQLNVPFDRFPAVW